MEPEPTPENNSVIAEVEDFIRRVRLGYFIITPRASTITFSVPRDSPMGTIIRKNTENLADLLSHSMSLYEASKKNPLLRAENSAHCLSWIDRAFSWAVVDTEGKGLVDKLEKCQEKDTQLEKDLADLSAQLLILQGKYEELTKLIPKDQNWRKS